jgi:hypothetical protein
MPISISPFLRNALYLDALVSGVAAVLLMGGASLLTPWLGLPGGLMFWAGLALVPYVCLLVAVARRQTAPRIVIIDIVALNALWAAASIGLLVSGAVQPTVLGLVFVSVQALAVLLFAELQFIGLRRSAATTVTA